MFFILLVYNLDSLVSWSNARQCQYANMTWSDHLTYSVYDNYATEKQQILTDMEGTRNQWNTWVALIKYILQLHNKHCGKDVSKVSRVSKQARLTVTWFDFCGDSCLYPFHQWDEINGLPFCVTDTEIIGPSSSYDCRERVGSHE